MRDRDELEWFARMALAKGDSRGWVLRQLREGGFSADAAEALIVEIERERNVAASRQFLEHNEQLLQRQMDESRDRDVRIARRAARVVGKLDDLVGD